MVQQLCISTETQWKVRLCLDPARLNEALIRLVHRGATLNDILQKLNNVKYLSLIDVSSVYQNLKLDERSSYLTTSAFQFSRYRYKKLPFGVGSGGDMFQRKIDKIFKNLPSVFGIADDSLGEGYNIDGKDHEDTVKSCTKIQKGKPKTIQRQMPFQICISTIFH